MHSRGAPTNVAGQSVVPVLLSAREKILDRDKYASARSIDLDGFEQEARPTATAA